MALLLFLYLNPFTLLILTFPQGRVFLIINTLVLSIWLWASSERFKITQQRVRIPEILIGSTLVIAAFALNLPTLRESSFGIVDMFLVFLGLTVVFYGIKGLKTLSIPLLFFISVIVVSQIEFAVDAVRNLEYTLLGPWGNTFSPLLGIETQVYEELTRVTTVDGTYFLEFDGPLRGLRGIVAYGSLGLVMLVAPSAPRARKIILALLVVAGTYLFTIVRLGVVLAGIAALGVDAGLAIQNYLGFLILSGWILIFKFFALPFLARSASPLVSSPTGDNITQTQ